VGDAELERDLGRVRVLARVMDTAVGVPGTRIRFGLDALIGLVPGAGDVVSALFAGYPVMIALRHRLPRWVLLRMLGNVLVDAMFGAIPLLGDLFDVAFKANVRNERLLLRYASRPERTTRESAIVLGILVSVAALLLVGILAFAIWMVQRGLAYLAG
jgi:hypothetical protein